MLPLVNNPQQNSYNQFFCEGQPPLLKESYNDTLEKIKRFKERVKQLDRDYIQLSNSVIEKKLKQKKKKKQRLPPIKHYPNKSNTNPSCKNQLFPNGLPDGNINVNNSHIQTDNLYAIALQKECKPSPPISEELYKRLLNHKPLLYIDFNEKEKEEKMRSKSPPLPQSESLKYITPTTSSKNKFLTPIYKSKKLPFRPGYIIYSGNNKEMIQRVMKTRGNWEEKEKEEICLVHFLWSPLSSTINFTHSGELNQWVNHFEYNSEISNKKKLYVNLLKYCEANNIDLFSFLPFTIIVPLSNQHFKSQLDSFERLYNSIDTFIDSDSPSSPSSSNEDNKDKTETKLSQLFITNYSKRIGNKQRLYIPQSHYDKKNLWLIKAVNLNRGRGIKIEHDLKKIIAEMTQLQLDKRVPSNANANPSQNPPEDLTESKIGAEYIILQKYIEKPLLYHKRKFDIRMWVLIIDKSEGYIFKEGHLKETCVDYNLNSLDPFVHLTNYSVQKHHANFAKESAGNEISFTTFQQELDKDKERKVSFRKDVYKKICHIVRITIQAAKNQINLIGRKNCFEIFGYDFMIDCNYNPYLIEINTNPGLEESSPVIKMLVPRMVDDALRLTIDLNPIFKGGDNRSGSGNNASTSASTFEVDGYTNEENMWEKLK